MNITGMRDGDYMNKYYLLSAQIEPFGCHVVNTNFVLSISPAAYLIQYQDKMDQYTSPVYVQQWSEISEKEYRLLKPHNPGVASYFKLPKSEQGKDR